MLKERAEDYTFEELSYQPIIRKDLVNNIRKYIENPSDSGLFVLGRRGYGKTFCVLKAVESCIEEKDLIPLIYSFDLKGNVSLKSYELLKLKKIKSLESANCLILNDFHNILERVKSGKEKLSKPMKYLKYTKKFIDEGKAVIIVSENPLNYYSLEFSENRLSKSSEFDDLIVEFGQGNPLRWIERDYRHKIKYNAYTEIGPFSLEEAKRFSNYVLNCEIPMEISVYYIGKKSYRFYDMLSNIYTTFKKTSYFINSFTNPRTLIKLRNRFLGKKEISLKDLAQLAKIGVEKLPLHKKRKVAKNFLNAFYERGIIINDSLMKDIRRHYFIWEDVFKELFELPLTEALYRY